MDLRLFSIENAPKSLPVWETILDDLGHPPASGIARALGVGVSSVYRWTQTGQVPRMACLSLFWLTRWGRSEIDCRATNDAMTAVGLARSLHEERTKLRATVESLLAERAQLEATVQRFRRVAHESAARGSSAIAPHSRTDTALGGSWGGGWSLNWAPQGRPVVGTEAVSQALAPVAPQTPAQAPQAAQPLQGQELAGRRGSPAARPPGAHSERCPAVERRHQPQPSSRQEVARSSPLVSERAKSDAIMASYLPDGPALPKDAEQLLELRQVQEPSGPSGALRLPPAGPAAAPPEAGERAGRASFGGRAGRASRPPSTEHASKRQDGRRAEGSKDEAPTVCDALSGAPAPAPAGCAFAAIAAALT